MDETLPAIIGTIEDGDSITHFIVEGQNGQRREIPFRECLGKTYIVDGQSYTVELTECT